MGTKVVCFLLEQSDVAEESLRRYVSSDKMKCPLPFSYHNAIVVIGQVPWTDPNLQGKNDENFPKDDPRWPKVCACGYVFQPGDPWQHDQSRMFKRDDGQLYNIRNVPPGAMYDATWYHIFGTGADGKSLVVRLPDGCDWLIDGPSTGGGRWSRTGTAPKITTRPSILTPGYHGYITDGVLESC